MNDANKLPPNLYGVIRFTSRSLAGVFPSLDAAAQYRDEYCSSGSVYAMRILDDGHYVLGAKLT